MTRLNGYRTTAILIALVVTLRFPTLLDSMYLVDEGYSGAIASEMLHGGAIYKTAVDTRPPFIYYTYYLIFLIAGQNNLLAVHIAAILFIIATTLVVRAIGSVVYGQRAGCWAAIGYVVFSHTYLPRDTLAANVEIFTLLPLTLGFYWFLEGERKKRLSLLVLSGVCCGVATFYRQPSVVNLGVMGGYLMYLWWILKEVNLRYIMKTGGAVFAGFLVSTAGIVLYHQMEGNLAEMVEWTWYIALRYVNSETTAEFVTRRIFLVHFTFILAGALLWYFGLKHLLLTFRNAWRKTPETTGSVLIAFWFAGAYSLLFTGWRFPGHYHLTVLPPLAVLAGTAFAGFLDRLPDRALGMRRFLVGAAVVPALGFLVMAFIIRPDTVAFRPIPDYIAANTSAEDRIFVWGSAPQVYSFSNRRMAARFVSGSHLVGMYASRPHKDIDSSKWIVPGSWAALDADFNLHPPELIIDMSSISSNWDRHPISRYPVLQRHLGMYHLEDTILGARIYRRNKS